MPVPVKADMKGGKAAVVSGVGVENSLIPGLLRVEIVRLSAATATLLGGEMIVDTTPVG